MERKLPNRIKVVLAEKEKRYGYVAFPKYMIQVSQVELMKLEQLKLF